MPEPDADAKEAIIDAFRRHDHQGRGVISRAKLKSVLARLGLGFLKDGDIDMVLQAQESYHGHVPYEELVDWITSPSTRTPAGSSRCSTGLDSGDKLQAQEEAGAAEARHGLVTYCASALASLREIVPSVCPKGHALARFFTNHGHFGCDWCGRAQALGDPMLGCRCCDYDLCDRCTGGEKVTQLVKGLTDAWTWIEHTPSSSREEIEGRRQELENEVDQVVTELTRPLTRYLQHSYANGDLFEDARYKPERDEALQLPMLVHGKSGIRVLSEAIDLRSPSAPSEPYLVLFCYMSSALLRKIMCEASERLAASFSGPKDVHNGHFGSGIYASCKEPELFGSKQAVLFNHHWPRLGSAEKDHCSPSGSSSSDSASGPEDPRNAAQCAAVLSDERLRGMADYCVPLLVPENVAFNIWQRVSPGMPGGRLGCNLWGEKQWPDRDIWVVQATAEVTDVVDRRVSICRRRVARLQETKGPLHSQTLAYVADLAWLLRGIGEYVDAEPLFRLELQVTQERLGPSHPDTLTSVDNLASLLKAMGVFAEAEQLYRRAVEGSERELGHSHPDTLTSINNLAGLLKATGKLVEAEAFYRRAWEGSKAALGDAHPDTLKSLSNLAGCLTARGDLAEAEMHYRTVCKRREHALGPSDIQTIRSASCLASVLEAQGCNDKAEELYLRSYQRAHTALGPVHAETSANLVCLTEFLDRQGRALTEVAVP